MLTGAVVNDIVKKLNDATDIPFVSEAIEGLVIEKLVVLIDSHLPPWVAQFMASAADGLTVEELKVHEDVIVTDLCKRINMSKLLPDFVEAKLIRYVVNAVLEYARVGFMAPGV
jgi:hypothetical protein